MCRWCLCSLGAILGVRFNDGMKVCIPKHVHFTSWLRHGHVVHVVAFVSHACCWERCLNCWVSRVTVTGALVHTGSQDKYLLLVKLWRYVTVSVSNHLVMIGGLLSLSWISAPYKHTARKPLPRQSPTWLVMEMWNWYFSAVESWISYCYIMYLGSLCVGRMTWKMTSDRRSFYRRCSELYGNIRTWRSWGLVSISSNMVRVLQTPRILFYKLLAL